MAREDIELGVDTKDGVKAAAALEAQIADLNKRILESSAAIGQDEAASKKAAAEIKELTKQKRELASTLNAVEQASGRAAGGMAGFGQSALQTGRIAQDFAQGGVGGVINNLEGLAMALGGGPGLAGVMTALGVGFLIFKPQIMEFLDSFKTAPIKEFTGVIETLEAKIKELTEKPHKVSLDLQHLETAKEQLDALKKGLAAYEAAKTGRTADEKAAGDEFTKQFEGTGREGADALDAVKSQVGDAAAANDPKVRAFRKELGDRERNRIARERAQKEAEARATAAMTSGADIGLVEQLATEAGDLKKQAEAFANPAETARLRDEIKKAVDDAKMKARAEVGNNIDDVKKGNNPIARGVLADRFRAAGQGKFADMVDASSPEAQAAKTVAKQSNDLDADNRKAFNDWKKLQDKKIQEEREKAGRAAEQDPAFKRAQADIDRKFKGFGLQEKDAETVRLDVQKDDRAQAAREAKAGHSDDIATPQQQRQRQEARQEEAIAGRIFQAGQGQFTPDQARGMASQVVDQAKELGQAANLNQLMMAAMQEAYQTMLQFQQQQQMMGMGFQQMGAGFRQMRVQGATRLDQ